MIQPRAVKPTGPAAGKSAGPPKAKGPAPAKAGGAAAAAGGQTSVVVGTKTGDGNPAVQKLVGDYAEKGVNHGRKFYEKDDGSVFLYFWDQRDGNDVSGWWFGDKVGGTEVFALCQQQTAAPPPAGWKVPWDAPGTSPGILTVSVQNSKAAASTAPGGKVAPAAAAAGVKSVAAAGCSVSAASAQEWTDKIKAVTDQVATAEAATKETLESARALLADSGGAGNEAVTEMLTKTQEMLNETQKELAEEVKTAKAAGQAGAGLVSTLVRLSPKLRTLQASITIEVNKLKGPAAKTSTAAPKAAAGATSEKLVQDLSAAIATFKEKVSAAEQAVETVASTAAPLQEGAPDANSEEHKAGVAEVEKLAKAAQEQITALRADIMRKNATVPSGKEDVAELKADCQEMLKKLSAAQVKLTPYKSFKAQLQQKAAAKKAVQQVTEKVEAAEAEVEKLAALSISPSASMSDSEIAAAEAALAPVQKAVKDALALVEGKIKTAGGALKEELTGLNQRLTPAKDKVEEAAKTLQKHKKAIELEKAIEATQAKVEAAEKAASAYEEAESPFIEGAEASAEESAKALAAAEAANKKVEAAITQARLALKKQLTDAKALSEGAALQSINERLLAMQEKVEAAARKVAEISTTTFERKYAAVLAEAFTAASACEAKVKELAEAAQPLGEGVEDKALADLRPLATRAAAAEKAASQAVADAKKAMSERAREKKTGGLSAALAQLQGRLTNAQQEVVKHKKVIAVADKLYKAREALEGGNEKIRAITSDLDRLEGLVGSGSKLSDAEATDIMTVTEEAQKVLKAVAADATKQLPLAPAAMKEGLEKVEPATKELLKKVQGILDRTKDERERVTADAYTKEVEQLAQEAEAAMGHAETAELPFLSGMEELPLVEGREIVAKCQAASHKVDEAVAAARAFIKAKTAEVKSFKPASLTPLKEAMGLAIGKLDQVHKKLQTYKTDTNSRLRTVRLQSTRAAVAAAAEKVDLYVEAVKPMEPAKAAEGEEAEAKVAPTADEVTALCEKVAGVDATAQAQLDDATGLVNSWSKDTKGVPEEMTALAEQLAATEKKLLAARIVAGEYEERFVADKILAEAKGVLEKAQAEVAKATEACAPLVAEGGDRFLVAVSAQTLASVLREYMKDKGLTEETLFKKAAGKSASKVSREAFVAFLKTLPAETGKEEVDFTDKRQGELYDHTASDKEAGVTLEDFKRLFVRRFTCIAKVTVTENLSISEGKTVTKVDVGEEMEAIGEQAEDGPTGMTRIEVKLLSGKHHGKTGWVSIRGNQGTVFIQAESPFIKFTQELDKKMQAYEKSAGELLKGLKARIAELPVSKPGPLKVAKMELNKMAQQVGAEVNKITALKNKAATAKKDFAKKEEAEKVAHVARKERAIADAALAVVKEKMQAAEDAVKAVKEAAAPLVKLKGEALEAFETPLATLRSSESLHSASKAAVEELKNAIKEQLKTLANAAQKGPIVDAKKEFASIQAKVDALQKGATADLEAARTACSSIARPKCEAACNALLQDMQKKGLQAEEFFLKLSGGGHRISEESLTQYLASLPGLTISAEHSGLICHCLQEGGISRRKFFPLVQKYYLVLKEIALTDVAEISKCKPIRKAEANEVIQMTECPITDPKTGLIRIKGRALIDGQEGWISVSGNKGTPFIGECEKPYYVCTQEVEFQSEFDSSAATALRKVKVDEVLELIDGPRKETRAPVLRAKVKATADGVQGFLTVKDGHGVEFAKAAGYQACCTIVALTDDLDIKKGKTLRKLAIGEVLEVLEGPVDAGDAPASIARMRVRCLKDQKEGWVTSKGTGAAAYVKESQKHYVVVQDCPLEKQSTGEGGEVVRTLKEGEVVEVLMGPKESRMDPAQRVKCRALGDSAEGWFTLRGDAVKACTPFYKVLVAVPLRKACEKDGAEVRKLAVGEMLELVGGSSDGPGGAWIKVRTEKDGAIGWVPVRAGAKPFVEPLASSSG